MAAAMRAAAIQLPNRVSQRERAMYVRVAFVPLLTAVFCTLVSTALTARAKDFLLTIGGGYDPTGNQLSLERNVIFQQKVVVEQRSDKPICDVYFADGENDNRDVQCRD